MMAAASDVYIGLGELLEYPVSDVLACATNCRQQLADRSPEAAGEIKAFADSIAEMDQGALEELYTATFDLSPACTPYVSVHLFGAENYKRGEMMAQLRGAYTDYNFTYGSELPDHLAVLLRFLPHLPVTERRKLIRHSLLGPVHTMTMKLQKAENPYRFLLRAIWHLLEADSRREDDHA